MFFKKKESEIKYPDVPQEALSRELEIFISNSTLLLTSSVTLDMSFYLSVSCFLHL